MSPGDAAGREVPSRGAGTPAAPGRAQTAEKRPRSPSWVICLPTLGSVPTRTAVESSELPGVPLEWHNGSREPSLGSKRCGSVRGPSVLPALPRWAEGSLLPRVSIPCPCQPLSATPGILGKGWRLPTWATMRGQHPSLEKPLRQGPWDGNTSGKRLLIKKMSLSPKAAWRAFAPIVSLCVGLRRRSR